MRVAAKIWIWWLFNMAAKNFFPDTACITTNQADISFSLLMLSLWSFDCWIERWFMYQHPEGIFLKLCIHRDKPSDTCSFKIRQAFHFEFVVVEDWLESRWILNEWARNFYWWQMKSCSEERNLTFTPFTSLRVYSSLSKSCWNDVVARLICLIHLLAESGRWNF